MNVASASWRTEYVSVPGARLACSVSGSGPVLVVAHGLFASFAATRREPLLVDAEVGIGRQHVYYDARGHGHSGGRPVASDYTWRNLALDLLAVLDRFSPDEPATVIGSSMGAATALHAAVGHPGRFERLVLLSPPTAWQSRAARAAELAAGPAGAEEWDGVDVPSELLADVMHGAATSDLPALDTLRDLSVPTLVVGHRGDPVHPLDTACALADAIPGAELRVIPRDDVTRRTRAIAAFLGEVDAESSS